MKTATNEILIVGGGVIGLSLAYELEGQGAKVRVVDRGPLGREASWAGAGILPPTGTKPQHDPYAELFRISGELYPVWSANLREETGVDNGYRQCGALYLSTDEAEDAELKQTEIEWRTCGVRVEPLEGRRLAEREPALAAGNLRSSLRSAWFLPEEAQVRNPRHLKALASACARRGVELCPGVAVEGFEISREKVARVVTSNGTVAADQICIASGPWSTGLLARLGINISVYPVRGQMVLLSSPKPVLRSIINVAKRYLVPRPDGRILVGSTEEDAGFDKRTTAQAIAGLLDFAVGLVPPLGDLQIEQCWAGLRPASGDGRPYLGRVPGYDNLFLASGHFRNGLQLSPATAVIMSRLMLGAEPGVDLSPFRVDR